MTYGAEAACDFTNEYIEAGCQKELGNLPDKLEAIASIIRRSGLSV